MTAPTLGWSALPVGARLRSELGIPVLVDNDVNTLAAAEQVHGIGLECRSISSSRSDEGRWRHRRRRRCPAGLHWRCRGDRPPARPVGRSGLRVRRPRLSGVADRRGSPGSHGSPERAHPQEGRNGGNPPRGGCGCNAGCAAPVQAGRSAPGPSCCRCGPLRRPGDRGDPGGGRRGLAGLVAGFEESFRGHLMGRRRGIPFLVRPWSEQEWAEARASLVLAAPFDSSGTSGEQGRLVRARRNGIQRSAADELGIQASRVGVGGPVSAAQRDPSGALHAGSDAGLDLGESAQLEPHLPMRWVGLGNYSGLLTDEVTRDAFLHTVMYCAGYLPIVYVGGSGSPCCSTSGYPPVPSSGPPTSCRS